MQYLKTSLKGDALKLANHLTPTSENYKACYELLQRRYTNKRELLGKLLDSILNLPKHNTENYSQLNNSHIYLFIFLFSNLYVFYINLLSLNYILLIFSCNNLLKPINPHDVIWLKKKIFKYFFIIHCLSTHTMMNNSSYIFLLKPLLETKQLYFFSKRNFYIFLSLSLH